MPGNRTVPVPECKEICSWYKRCLVKCHDILPCNSPAAPENTGFSSGKIIRDDPGIACMFKKKRCLFISDYQVWSHTMLKRGSILQFDFCIQPAHPDRVSFGDRHGA